jgi:hypothetical protein
VSWIFDNIPWWVWLLLAGGGGGALLALVPGALAFVIGVYNAMPVWLRWVTGAAIVAWLAHIAGRNIGRANARAEQDALDRRARDKATEVNRNVDKLDQDQVDSQLEKDGGLWDDDPPKRPPFGRRTRT